MFTGAKRVSAIREKEREREREKEKEKEKEREREADEKREEEEEEEEERGDLPSGSPCLGPAPSAGSAIIKREKKSRKKNERFRGVQM